MTAKNQQKLIALRQTFDACEIVVFLRNSKLVGNRYDSASGAYVNDLKLGESHKELGPDTCVR
jgi:hypothetical protein